MKYLIFCLLVLGLAGCTTGNQLSDQPNMWVIDRSVFAGLFWRDYLYCMARPAGSSNAAPICYKAPVVDWEPSGVPPGPIRYPPPAL